MASRHRYRWQGLTRLAGRPAAAASAARAGRAEPEGKRADIQGLRAIAVLAVLVFHLAPHALPGGFVGVDVFFVISGYLITAHLARADRSDGRVRLGAFWARRARRLLPAAALVLAATWALAQVALPAAQLPDTAAQIRASALYYENWSLARAAVSYLASTNAPTPVQHYWSLSVEEQFYLVWPLVFLLAWVVTRRFPRARRAVLVGLLLAVVGWSLWFSVHETATNPAAAYFVTTTRMWELGLGGLLALLPARAVAALARRRWPALVGLALIAVSLVEINPSSAFPGSIALLPTAGAGILLVSGWRRPRWSPAALLSTRPMVGLGDISYSLYLWHWPLIVLWTGWVGAASLSPEAAVVIGLLSIALAWATKRYVEDPIRLAPRLVGSPARSLATATVVLVPVLVVALSSPSTAVSARLDRNHPGAAVLAGTAAAPPPEPVTPTLVAAPSDVAGFQGCEVVNNDSRSIHCRLGDTTNPRLTVAVVGDSVVGQWQTVLDEIAERRHWLLITDYKASCDWSTTMTAVLGGSAPYTSCHDWGVHVAHDLLTNIHPDVIITSGRATYGTPAHPTPDATSFHAIAEGMARYWREMMAAGTTIVAIDPTPEMGQNEPDCLSSAHGSPASCSVPRRTAVSTVNAVRQAAMLVPGAHLIDMNSLICGATICSPVVGNVVVYLDQHHLTQTYTETLQPFLERRLLAVAALRDVR